MINNIQGSSKDLEFSAVPPAEEQEPNILKTCGLYHEIWFDSYFSWIYAITQCF